MGLDIRAFRGLKKVENPELKNGYVENWDTEWQASFQWCEQHFPGRAEGIEEGAVYTWEDQMGFLAGSYSGYNKWRDRLDQFKGNSAFQELINFPDNEGVIGPVVAAKLYQDFVDHEEDAKKYAETLEDGDWWYRKYQNFKEAFEFAKDRGAVNFE